MASTVKILVFSIMVSCLLLVPHALFPFGNKDKQVAETRASSELQDRYNALAAPGIIMLPANRTSAVSPDYLAQIERELLKQLVNAGKVKPVSMQRWLSSTYASKASSPFAIMNAIRAEEYIHPLQYMGKPAVFRDGGNYYFVLYIYPLETYYPVTIFRRFTSKDPLDEMIASCIGEMDSRLSRSVSVGAKRRVIIDDFKLEFLRLVQVSSGEFDFIPTPFIEEENIILRDGDDFFSRIMGYVLEVTDLFQVMRIGDFNEYSEAVIPRNSNLADYRIQGRVQLSGDESVLYVDVLEVRTGAKILSLRQPLLPYSLDGMWSTYRRFSVQIVEKLFERESYGVVPTLKWQNRNFTANNMFVGWDTLENFILPRGLHVISAMSPPVQKGSRVRFVNTYHVILDSESFVYADAEGERIWNLLQK